MAKEVEIGIDPDHINDEAFIRQKALRKARVKDSAEVRIQLIRKSIDARGEPGFRLRIKVFSKDEQLPKLVQWKSNYEQVKDAPEVLIIGAGPAGYFAALECLELGLRPIVLERGKDVRQRRRDLKAIQQLGIVNPESNYCFGEGGAGTYSDGKLYTRSKKRGNVEKVLQILVEHGANKDILVDAHPHIGSNKLPNIIKAIRGTIISHGGEIRFNTKLSDLNIVDGEMQAVMVNDGHTIKASRVILATGHSARDIYALLERNHLSLEPKPFAIGVRVEHPQMLIDEMQYGQRPRHRNLPAAAYRLATTTEGPGVFSFCMCPGGLIVPAATEPGEIVVNGMSLSRRDSPYANSGIVVSVEPSDWTEMGYDSVLGGLQLQQDLERRFFQAGNGSQAAPAQRVSDFLRGIKSKSLPPSSYIPGLLSVAINELLPDFLYHHLCRGMLAFERKLPGFVTSDAVVVGLESRTSSPLRIPRHKTTLAHPMVKGLYPCGEGAGYAGGIVSAAIDGQMVSRAIATQFK